MVGLAEGPAEWVFDRGTHLSAVTSAAERLASQPADRIIQMVASSLARQLPGLAGREPQRSIVIKEKRATPILDPEGASTRPGPRSPLRNLYLTGDWTDTGLPPTLEGAAESAQRAVDAIVPEVIPHERVPPRR
jgi:uncharacterized protein with NAD-binding domain and iron-sulfur cluster